MIEMPSLGEGLSTRGVIPYKKGERCTERGVVYSEDWLLKKSTNPPAEGCNSVSAGHSRKSKSCDELKDNEGNKVNDYHVNNDDENELSENEYKRINRSNTSINYRRKAGQPDTYNIVPTK